MYKKEEDLRKFLYSKGISSNLFYDYENKAFKNSYIEPTVIEERNVSSMVSLSVYSRLMMDRILFLGTEINEDVANIFSAQLLWLEQQSDKDQQEWRDFFRRYAPQRQFSSNCNDYLHGYERQ